MISTEKVDHFDFSRLYGDEKYSLNGMELASTNFHEKVERGHSVWSDRVGSLFYNTAEELGIKSSYNGDAYFAGFSAEDLLRWGKAIAQNEQINYGDEVTGVRITRYTNQMSGYPTLCLELVTGGSGKIQAYKHRPDPRFSFDKYEGEFYGYFGGKRRY